MPTPDRELDAPLISEIQRLRGVIVDAAEQIEHGVNANDVHDLLMREWYKPSVLDAATRPAAESDA